MVFKKDLIKFKKIQLKIQTIRKDIKKLKYVKTIQMYKILAQIHLNYKFKNNTFEMFRFMDCLIAWLRESKFLMAWNSFKLPTLKRLRLKIFRFTDCLIVWLRELKSVMAWNAVRCLPQFLLKLGSLRFSLVLVL